MGSQVLKTPFLASEERGFTLRIATRNKWRHYFCLGFFTVFLLLSPTSCSTSCSNGSTTNKITICAKTGWADFNLEQFTNLLEAEVEKQAAKEGVYTDFDINFDNSVPSDKIVLDNVISGKADLGFVAVTEINLLKDKKEDFDPYIQTLTNSFIFDSEESFYEDGSNSDPLIQQAEEETAVFLGTNDSSLAYATNSSWNTSIYENYYEAGQLVDFYRGCIWIYGTAEKINHIKDAWNNKDWETFKSFGIVYGSTDSGGQFKLQESLIKKHFDLSEDFSLNEDFISDEKNFSKEGSATDLHDYYPEYHIAFDDNGSFAYTPNSLDNESSAEPFKIEDGCAMEILTVTEPLKYDVGVFSQNFPEEYKEIVANAFINLAKEGWDLYGPTYGYNGYEIIGSENVEYEVYTKYEEVMGN